MNNIEDIANRMMEISREFYKNPLNGKHIQKCIKHRDNLKSLLDEARAIRVKTGRVMEIDKILSDAVDYFNEVIKKLRRAH